MNLFDAQITFCYTRDLPGTARFYEEVMGLPVALDQGACRVYRVAGRGFVGFCTREEASKPEGIILTFVTKDVDGWYERLKGRGVEFEQAPRRNPKFKIYHCLLRDPNGYLVEIQRFEDPEWARGSE